jgi:hypothetical protein
VPPLLFRALAQLLTTNLEVYKHSMIGGAMFDRVCQSYIGINGNSLCSGNSVLCLFFFLKAVFLVDLVNSDNRVPWYFDFGFPDVELDANCVGDGRSDHAACGQPFNIVL